MPLSNPVIRRYTPPTCTLEIWAQKSPISRWAKQSVLKQLTFELQLDDPRLSEEDKVTIRGDREQLEALCTKVSDYVQELLQKDTENFWLSFQASQANHQAINEPPPRDLSNTSAFAHASNADTSNADTSNTNTSNTGNSNTDTSNTGNSNAAFSQTPTGSIHLQPNTHLKHKLFLGSLTNRSTGEFVELSLLQLFDLASALENYSAEFIALPMSSSNAAQRGNTWSTWGPVAAVVAIAAGLTPVTWQYANRLREQQVATESSPQENTVASNSSPLQTSSQPGLSPSSSLPNQPALTADLPLPVSPLPATSSIPPQTGTAGQPQQLKPNIPTSPQAPSNNSFIKPPTPNSNTLTIPAPPSSQIANSSIKLPTAKVKQNSQATINSNLTQNKLPPITPPSNVPEAIKNPLTSSLTSADLSSKKINETSKPAAVLNPDVSLGSGNNRASDSTDTSGLIATLRQSRQSNSSQIATGDSSLISSKQIAEVKKYLKQRWQPPSGLKQSLEYSLTVGVDGSIEQILPLGKAARENFSSTGMPAIGDPFISPSKTGQDARIRAVFSPNGKVQVLPETE